MPLCAALIVMLIFKKSPKTLSRTIFPFLPGAARPSGRQQQGGPSDLGRAVLIPTGHFGFFAAPLYLNQPFRRGFFRQESSTARTALAMARKNTQGPGP
jgi:hypothetical protein